MTFCCWGADSWRWPGPALTASCSAFCLWEVGASGWSFLHLGPFVSLIMYLWLHLSVSCLYQREEKKGWMQGLRPSDRANPTRNRQISILLLASISWTGLEGREQQDALMRSATHRTVDSVSAFINSDSCSSDCPRGFIHWPFYPSSTAWNTYFDNRIISVEMNRNFVLFAWFY